MHPMKKYVMFALGVVATMVALAFIRKAVAPVDSVLSQLGV
jgi:hypothetical protein